MNNVEIKISGMSCGHCVMAVKKELSKLYLNSVDVEVGSAKITFEEDKVNFSEIEKAIEEAGYKVVKNL